jgi:hypothetical protein
MFPVSDESQAEAGQCAHGKLHSKQFWEATLPRENDGPQKSSSGSKLAQDEVKVHLKRPGKIAVYKFLDQNGALISQMQPQQTARSCARD